MADITLKMCGNLKNGRYIENDYILKMANILKMG